LLLDGLGALMFAVLASAALGLAHGHPSGLRKIKQLAPRLAALAFQY